MNGPVPVKPGAVMVVRRELDAGIEAELFEIPVAVGEAGDEMELADAVLPAERAPASGAGAGLRHMLRPVYDEDRLSLDPHIPWIGEERQHASYKLDVALGRVVLLHEHLVFRGVPFAGPVLVRPVQAEADIAVLVGQEIQQRPFQQATPAEPVVVEAEGVDAEAFGQDGLLALRFAHAKVVVAEVGRLVRLVMPREQRLGLCGVGPFGEALAPPKVVLGNGMELRKVERDQLQPVRACRRMVCQPQARPGCLGALGARRPRFDHGLVDMGKCRRLKQCLCVGRQGAPWLCELGLHRGAEDVGEIDDRQPGLVEQSLHGLDGKEADMGAVEQSPVPVGEVAAQQAAQDRRMGDVRQRHDNVAARVQQACGTPERRPGIVEMFQDVGDDDGVEAGVAEGIRPGWVVEVLLDHPLAKACENFDAFRVNFEGGELGVVEFHERTRDGAWPGADLQHPLSPPHEAKDVGRRSVRCGIHAIPVYVRRGLRQHVISFSPACVVSSFATG